MTYTVNALDQRINKTAPAVVGTRYLYGGQNWLLGERNASKRTSYLWNGDEPMAMVRGTHINHLHTLVGTTGAATMGPCGARTIPS